MTAESGEAAAAAAAESSFAFKAWAAAKACQRWRMRVSFRCWVACQCAAALLLLCCCCSFALCSQCLKRAPLSSCSGPPLAAWKGRAWSTDASVATQPCTQRLHRRAGEGWAGGEAPPWPAEAVAVAEAVLLSQPPCTCSSAAPLICRQSCSRAWSLQAFRALAFKAALCCKAKSLHCCCLSRACCHALRALHCSFCLLMVWQETKAERRESRALTVCSIF